jgi:hypothetical protein
LGVTRKKWDIVIIFILKFKLRLCAVIIVWHYAYSTKLIGSHWLLSEAWMKVCELPPYFVTK